MRNDLIALDTWMAKIIPATYRRGLKLNLVFGSLSFIGDVPDMKTGPERNIIQVVHPDLDPELSEKILFKSRHIDSYAHFFRDYCIVNNNHDRAKKLLIEMSETGVRPIRDYITYFEQGNPLKIPLKELYGIKISPIIFKETGDGAPYVGIWYVGNLLQYYSTISKMILPHIGEMDIYTKRLVFDIMAFVREKRSAILGRNKIDRHFRKRRNRFIYERRTDHLIEVLGLNQARLTRKQVLEKIKGAMDFLGGIGFFNAGIVLYPVWNQLLGIGSEDQAEFDRSIKQTLSGTLIQSKPDHLVAEIPFDKWMSKG